MFKNFRNHSNYHDINKEFDIQIGEKNDQPSMTIPDRVMSLKQLIARHRDGSILPRKDAQYEEDLNSFAKRYPDIEKMTKLDLIEMGNDLTSYIKTSRDAIQKYNREKEEQATAEAETATETTETITDNS